MCYLISDVDGLIPCYTLLLISILTKVFSFNLFAITEIFLHIHHTYSHNHGFIDVNNQEIKNFLSPF